MEDVLTVVDIADKEMSSHSGANQCNTHLAGDGD